ncbi:MAG: helix-turn-helix domain-containing protein [Dehalococcoidia bacterium]
MVEAGRDLEEFAGAFEWQRALRDYRLAQRISQTEVARRSGMSVSAVKAYESGSRHPSREALAAIIDSLGMPVERANPVLAGAGYAIDWQGILNQRYEPRDLAWFTEEVERYWWPVIVTNQASDVLAANHCFRTLIGIPLKERLPNPRWNFVARASDPRFAARQESWVEGMSFIIGLAKADTRWVINPERQAPHSQGPYQEFLRGDPALITRMLELWQRAEPVPHTTRMTYPVRWRHEDGQLMRFTATMHVADVWQELSWHDWVPDNEETLRLLHR